MSRFVLEVRLQLGKVDEKLDELSGQIGICVGSLQELRRGDASNMDCVDARKTEKSRLGCTTVGLTGLSSQQASDGRIAFKTPAHLCAHMRKDASPTESEDGNAKVSVSEVSVSDLQGMRTIASTRESVKKTELALSKYPMKVEGRRASHLFVDVDQLKEKVLENLLKPEYDVNTLYHKFGLAQAIARNNIFEMFTLLVIAANAVWIAYDTDYNGAEVLNKAKPIFQIAEHLFCLFFTFEITVRFLAFRRKKDSLTDSWFVFDACLVAMMVAETWIFSLVLLLMGASGNLGNASMLRLLRLFRLSRIARMARLLRSMPELMILMKGIRLATQSVFFTLVLLTLNIYVFAIVFVQMIGDSDVGEAFFDTVPEAMYTLLSRGALLDSPGKVGDALMTENLVMCVVFYIFILLAALTVLNMLIGILCEVVSAVAAIEKEQITVAMVKQQLQKVVEELDENGDMMISKQEFLQILESPVAIAHLAAVGVDVCGLVDLADYIFSPEGEIHGKLELTFTDFMEVVLSLRGSNSATVKDIVDLRKFIATECFKMVQFTALVEDMIRNLVSSLEPVR